MDLNGWSTKPKLYIHSPVLLIYAILYNIINFVKLIYRSIKHDEYM